MRGPPGHSRGRGQRGFTLIELMIVIALIALLMGAAVMGVGAITGSRARQSAGELAGTIRSLYDTSSLTGKTCRIVFVLPGRTEEYPVRYWAECAQGNLTASSDRDNALKDDTKRAIEDAKHGRRPGDTASSRSTYEQIITEEKDRVENAAKFSAFKSEDVKPVELKGVQVRVWTRHQRDVATSGLAYLYFFPQGFTERAQIYFQQGRNTWTITVAPLTGKATVVGEDLPVPKV